MSLRTSRRLARYMEPDVDDRRIDRVWAVVSSSPVRSWPGWRFTALAGAVAAATAVVMLLLRTRSAAPALAGVVVESGSSETVTLADGTSATLRTGARLRYDRVQPDRVETTVERGEVAFDVHHTPGRTFVVHAGGVDLVDRGTRFVVDVASGSVHVSVESGQVDVTRTTGQEATIVLRGGESWTSAPPVSASSTAAQVSASSAIVEAPPIVGTEIGGASSQPAASAPIRVGPHELLQQAKEARLSGRPRDAALAFDTLRRRYPDDPRAGLAAFELGRLRLDSLGDPAGAAEALADSIALAPGATFREDAEARLVEAFDRMHDVGRCSSARQAYLARYSRGLHAKSVATRCP
jgi:transmembrane sensor